MSFIRRTGAPTGARRLPGATAAAMLVMLALVAPAGAGESPTHLSNPDVSPRTGTTDTAISFAVTYRHALGLPPAWVRVVIDGTGHRMTSDGGTDWSTGVLHTLVMTLPAGTHEVRFTAADPAGFRHAVGAGKVTIEDGPDPTPPPTPAPTPKPPPTPAPSPPPAPGPTPQPTPRPTATPRPTVTPQPTATPPAGAVAVPPPGSGTGPSPDPLPAGPVAGATPLLGDPASGQPGATDGAPFARDGWASDHMPGEGAGPTVPSGTADGGDASAEGPPAGPGQPGGGPSSAAPGWGALAAALQALGIDDPPPALGLLPTLVGTTGAVAMTMSFAIFGRKRRNEQPPAPDDVLRANAARGPGLGPTDDLLTDGAPGASAAPLDEEAALPRWRRPSLLQARRADPLRNSTGVPRLSFGTSPAGPAGDGLRRLIRYRVVRLMDGPDEFRAAEIGQLDQGDEVQLLEQSGAYWLVLCPDGRRGWLHKMTLGEVVGPPDPAQPTDAELDVDVLQAYLASRSRS